MPALREAKLAILVGAEGPGLTETVMRASDLRVRIPMARGTDSLNVATAAALAFYERARVDRRVPRSSRASCRVGSRRDRRADAVGDRV